MATDPQIEANRKNAQQSTGPRSADGKSRVASNALKHGLTAKQVVLPHEDPEEFEAFARKLRDALAPVGFLEDVLADKIASHFWRMMRVPMVETALHALAKKEAVIENLRQEIEDCENAPSADLLLEYMNPATRKCYLRAEERRDFGQRSQR